MFYCYIVRNCTSYVPNIPFQVAALLVKKLADNAILRENIHNSLPPPFEVLIFSLSCVYLKEFHSSMLWDSEDGHWGNAQFVPGIITYLEIKKLKYYYISLTHHLFTCAFLILKQYNYIGLFCIGFDHVTH